MRWKDGGLSGIVIRWKGERSEGVSEKGST